MSTLSAIAVDVIINYRLELIKNRLSNKKSFFYKIKKNQELKFKSMYIVVSVHPNDRECCDTGGMIFLILRNIKL